MKRRRYITIILMTMLLLMSGGNGNSASAITVTYKILTKPFTTWHRQGSGDNSKLDFKDLDSEDILVKHTDIRVEAMRCTSSETAIGLPEAFKSPLAKNYRYYLEASVNKTENVQIYGYSTTLYDTYSITNLADSISRASYTASADITVYVTYEYDENNGIIDLTKQKKYNIKHGENFLVYDVRWGNRASGYGVTATMNEGAYHLSDLNNTTLNNVLYNCVFNFGNESRNPGVTLSDPNALRKPADASDYDLFKNDYQNPDPYNIRVGTAYSGTGTYFEKDKNVGHEVVKEYRDSYFFVSASNTSVWMSSDYDKQWTNTTDNGKAQFFFVPGYFRGSDSRKTNPHDEMHPIINSFAVLNHPKGGGYIFVASKTAYKGTNSYPKSGSTYLFWNTNTGLTEMKEGKLDNSCNGSVVNFYEVRDYTFHVKTPFGHDLTAKGYWSDYAINVVDSAITVSHVPDTLKRKYCTITGFYKDAALTQKITKYSDLEDVTLAANRHIYIKYEADLPFETLPVGGSYTDATWYTMRLNGKSETKHIAYWENSKFKTGGGSNSNLHQGDNKPEAYFAFMGDPYEMKIINRKASEDDGANRYVGCAHGTKAPADFGVVETATDDPASPSDLSTDVICRWEIVPDNISNSMQFRQLGTYAAPKYIGWGYGESDNPMKYSTTATYVRVVELAKKRYVYHIVNNSPDPTVAVKASEEQEYGIKLSYNTIPEIIRSPFLAFDGVTISFYYTQADALGNTNAVTCGSYKDDSEYDIFVRYDMTSCSDARKNYINGTSQFNVRVNNQYIYYDNNNTTSKISSVGDIGDNASQSKYLWILGGNDPYAMTIKNNGATNPDYYIKATQGNNLALEWVSEGQASKFVIKGGTTPGVWEVMLATGTDEDASTIYYHIGRPEQNVVKIYSNGTYPHGYNQIGFQLTRQTASEVTYHLIDKTDKVLLTSKARHMTADVPQLPAEYWSPLVKTYYYYTKDKFKVDAGEDGELDTDDDIYELKSSPVPLSLSTVGSNKDIYVTYEANDLVDMEQTTMYLLKFEMGDKFYQENGSDGMISDEDYADANKSQAVYPYCNGDCNMNIYGQYQYDLQQEGAASTRTRWAWYVVSGNHDPYHVKILSRQTETYDGMERHAYFSTVKPDDYSEVVTTIVWPNISGQLATDYMVLGSEGHYQLVTSYPITIDKTSERYAVNSLEQYWKTYDTVKKKLLSDLLSDCEERERTDRTDGSIEVPTTPATLRQRLKGTGDGEYGFHSYAKMAYAKRWNGYNEDGEKKKGWEQREHWFQTVKMGEGYFDFVETTIDPALILLDQHGWEIMRKPIPSSPDDPKKAEKYAALAAYDSPMVKEYLFWSSAKKRSNFHQYYLMDKRIGDDFTSTTLTSLPPYGSTNVLDSKGNLNDQYVTYIVKDEYAQGYVPGSTPTAYPFLIQQGDNLAKNGSSATIATVDVSSQGASQYIIDNINYLTVSGSRRNELWYLKPNADIDTEMGYTSSNHDWDDTNPNAYEDDAYKYNMVAQVIEGSSSDATIKKYGRFSFSNGFDPYNIQISSNSEATTKYFTVGMTGAEVSEGIYQGSYGEQTVTLAAKNSSPVTGTGHDHSKLQMTNQTLMAVSDEDGNIQLMPRFDHTLRIRDFSTLVTPAAEAADPTKLEETHTLFYRPYVYNYRIIDNEGYEALRYQSGGELLPQLASHMKSPLAKDFKFYKAYASYNASTKQYTINESTDEWTSGDEITEDISLAGAGLTGASLANNYVYVRYAYDDEADTKHMLLGKWFTMKLNGKNATYDNGIKQNDTKPNPVDDDDQKWQWKFLRHSYSNPDPYAVRLFNRSQVDQPMWCTTLNGAGTVTATGGTTDYQRFVLLSHEDGGYALAVAGTENYTDYYFLNGNAMNTTTGATLAEETAFTSTDGSYDLTKSQIVLTDDVAGTYTYQVYTNDDPTTPAHDGKYGTLAIEGTQSSSDASYNDYAPELPDEIRSPLLNQSDFVYYEALDDIGNSDRELTNLYGLYDGHVVVRYTYHPNESGYKVPNQRNDVSAATVAKGEGSNDSPLRFGEEMLYNIIWHEDAMMQSKDGYSGITSKDNQPLNDDDSSVWQFLGDDPYAMKIKIAAADKYLHEATSNTCSLDPAPTTFMLLPKDDYDYGVIAVTGDKTKMLTNVGNQLTSENPKKYIIFAMSTLNVVYHLIIKNIGAFQDIPKRDYISHDYAVGGVVWNDVDGNYPSGDTWTIKEDTLRIHGTTKRDLTTSTSVAGDTYQLGETIEYPGLESSTLTNTTYCVSFGPISLGDTLTVPEAFYRPNVNYNFIVHDIFPDESADGSLNNLYKGLELKSKKMSLNKSMIGKTVYIDIVYGFNTDLTETNAGNNFVLSIDENKWYTLETVIDGTPWLAQYTNAWGFELKEGRGSHYTNDFLWTPIGDPYGFQLYNRYTDRNSGADNTGDKHKVINSYFQAEEDDKWPIDTNPFTPPASKSKEGKRLTMSDDGTNGDDNAKYSVYELLADENTTAGYFHFHPVVNTDPANQYYFYPIPGDDDGDETKNLLVRLSKTAAEFTFGLSTELVEPYYTRAGYVGGLTAAGKQKYEEAEGDLMKIQAVVYDDDYIEQFKTGYYRMHSPLGVSDINPVRYASGYTHKSELTGGASNNPIPMHFYELNSSQVRSFTDLKEGFTSSPATRGDITILPVAQDPASIFYCKKNASTNVGYMSAEGLYIKGEKGKGETTEANREGSGEQAKAIMVDTNAPATDASELFVMDIGGAILLIHDNTPPLYRKYLSYDDRKSDDYDLKLTHNTHTDLAKWCMQPVQKTATAGTNEMGLTLALHNGGDGYYYSSFYAPFDVLLSDATNDLAFICPLWNTEMLHLKKVGKYNTEANQCPEDYRGSNQFVPAGTAVIIRSTNSTVTLALPTTEPSTELANNYQSVVGNIFKGEYLEQLLAEENGSNDVYVFGVPYKGTFTKHTHYAVSNSADNGEISAKLPEAGDSDLGFYINATPNREAGPAMGEWVRNNRYVYNNRIYYRPTSSSRQLTRGAEFIPVDFDDDDEPIEEGGSQRRESSYQVFDLSGRCVASGQAVRDGSWRQRVAAGIYILDGRKISIR